MATMTPPVETVTPEVRAALPPSRVLADIGLIAGRNLRKVARNSRLIAFSTIQPLMQLILFAYVFAAVAHVPGLNYKDFVVPAVLVLFGMALAAFAAWVGLSVGDPETVQAAVFVPILPLIFTSSAFAPVSRLPGWMQPMARVNPITSAIDTARGLALGDGTLYRVSHVHLGTAAWHFALWWVLLVTVFTALAVRRYRLG